MKRKNIRMVTFVVVTLTYLIIGAALFDYFESEAELCQNQRLNKSITSFMTKHHMNRTEFNKLWNNIMLKKPYKAGHQWKFVGSLYFCTLVVTLIGYGHSTPRTFHGKGFCMLYALIGIPIFLIMFQSVGERLNQFIVYIFSYLKKRLGFKNPEFTLVELIAVEFGLAINIIIVASYVFAKSEGWSYFDAFYYCFITLLTIGFGDMVPLQSNNALSNNLSYAFFTIFFILIGLIILASSMNQLVLRLASITVEEQIQEKFEHDEAIRQMAFVEGDVINFNEKSGSAKEVPEEVKDNMSVCSCNCVEYDFCAGKRWRKKARKSSNTNSQSNLSDLYNTSTLGSRSFYGKVKRLNYEASDI